jgi:16S rRNA processing protein RimM
VNWDEMAVVGTIARPHGIRGQVFVNPETDFPEERFRPGATLYVRRGGRVEPVTVSTFRMQQARPVIGLDGVTDMDAARELGGLEFRVPVEALVTLRDGMFYHHDLVGCLVVTTAGLEVGTVSGVEGDAANTRLVVTADGGDVLIPLVLHICTEIDPKARRIVIAPPEGLIELNLHGK